MQNSPRIVFCGILAGEMINGRAGSSPRFMITIGDNLSTNLPSPEKLGGSELLQGRVEMCDVVTGGGGGVLRRRFYRRAVNLVPFEGVFWDPTVVLFSLIVCLDVSKKLSDSKESHPNHFQNNYQVNCFSCLNLPLLQVQTLKRCNFW